MSLRLLMGVLVIVCIGCLCAQGKGFVREPPRKTPVLYDADVVVIGGGLSGVGAALGAARTGANTVLVERTGYLGGWLRGTGMGNVLAVPGWRPALNEGVLLDFTKKMVKLGAEGYPDLETALEKQDLLVTNPEILPHAFQSLVIEAGAEILYFSTYTDSIVRNRKLEAIIVETPVGRGAIRGKVFVDCTGLATVAAESGAPVKRSLALMGLASWMSGVDVQRYEAYFASLPTEPDPEAREWLEKKLGYPVTRFASEGESEMDYPWDDWLARNSIILGKKFRDAVDRGEMPLFFRIGEKGVVSFIEGLKVIEFDITGGIARPRTYITGVDPTNIREVSEAHIRSAEYLFKLAAFLRDNVPGFEKAQLTRLANMTINRAGRSIKNDASPDSEDINTAVQHDDVIAILQRGPSKGDYEVPFGSMLPEKIDNLLAVGKSSSGGIKFRTHMLSPIMGQAAGTAAALAVQQGVLPRNVPIRQLQSQLRDAGIPLPEK